MSLSNNNLINKSLTNKSLTNSEVDTVLIRKVELYNDTSNNNSSPSSLK